MKNDTKQKILETSFRLFNKNGFFNVSLKQIADDVGITRSAIFYFFENKEALLDAVIDMFFFQVLNQALVDIKNLKGTVKDKLKVFYHTVPGRFEDHSTKPQDRDLEEFKKFFLLLIEGISRFEIVKKHYAQFIDHVSREYENILLEGIETGIISGELDVKQAAKENLIWGHGLVLAWAISDSLNIHDEIDKNFEKKWNEIRNTKGTHREH